MATHTSNTTPSRKDNPSSHFLSDLNSFEHASPTKALFHSRLNNDITSIVTWLETLLSPTATGTSTGTTSLPAKFLSWREEVYAASSSSQFYPTIGKTNSSATFGGDNGSKILESLKALKQANLLADHLRSLVHEARLEALGELEGRIVLREEEKLSQKQGRFGPDNCLNDIYAMLDGDAKGALEELQSAAILLNLEIDDLSGHERLDGAEKHGNGVEVVDTRPMSLFAQEILKCAHRRVVVESQLDRLRDLLCSTHNTLAGNTAAEKMTEQAEREERATLSIRDGTAGSLDESQTSYQLQSETAGFARDAKQINLKILEYQDRITGLRKQLSRLRAETVSIEHVLSTRKRVKERSNTVKDLKNRVKAFYGLPPDLTTSRMEIRRATVELAESKRKREELFERISTLDR